YHIQRINNLNAKLTQACQTEKEKNDYLTELNELDNDLREQANLLADKNAKLAQAIKEKNDLQTQLTNEKNLNQTLQAQINNHTCPASHICPPVNEANCS